MVGGSIKGSERVVAVDLLFAFLRKVLPDFGTPSADLDVLEVAVWRVALVVFVCSMLRAGVGIGHWSLRSDR